MSRSIDLLPGMFLCLAAISTGQAAVPVFVTPDAPVVRLDEIGLYRVGYAYRHGPERSFPLGWSSADFDEQTGVACAPVGRQNGKPAFLLHCPWRNGTGIAYQEFVFRLPKARRILLQGATALRTDAVGKSDGVTFRIRANGRELLDVHRADARWQPYQYDLTALAGRTLTLRFETDPGPRDDPSFDFALWGDRRLVLEGYRPAPVRRPSPPPLSLTTMASRRNGSVVPLSGYAVSTRVRSVGDTVSFRYAGPDGTLEFRWRKPRLSGDPLFGSLTLRAAGRGAPPVEVPLASDARAGWTAPVCIHSARWEISRDFASLVYDLESGQATATLRVTGRMIGKSLVLDIRSIRPVVGWIDAGGWGPVVRRKVIPVPYYSGQVAYLPREGLFVNTFLDWTRSSASSHEGMRAVYGALTDGTRHPLRETAVYTAAWHLAEVLPNLPNPPSPYLKVVGGRIVLDIWGERFADIARNLERDADYGLRDLLAIVHVWQRSGYDNALPAHYPANAELGGDAGMKDLIGIGNRLGYPIALHENYVDYYPNYDHFSADDIALDPSGKRVPAWYNPGTKIQSFAVKPNAILRLAATQSPEIHRRYGTRADYLDVHSAVPPWFHADFRAGEPGAGTFRRVWDAHRELWAYERRVHGGPVFGEGNDHWYWSGYLDGVEAQFGQGWPANQGMAAPLMVDFDLLRIHPLQANHGMGYYERWWDRPEWGHTPPMAVLDRYRMQEVAFGHAGFLGAPAWPFLQLAWLEGHLLAPVAARYAGVPVADVRYQVNGQWVDGDAAAMAGIWNRVRVTYRDGLTITANGTGDPLEVGAHLLPPYGWWASGAGIEAGTSLHGGVVTDYAKTRDALLVNARDARDWSMDAARRIRPEVAAFSPDGPRRFRVTYRWRVGERLGAGYTAFVHFVKPNGPGEGIAFQQDHSVRSARWRAGQTVTDGPYLIQLPEDLPDGRYDWRIGLYDPGSSGRLPLEGQDDGESRIRLGALVVQDGGRRIAFIPQGPAGDGRGEWQRRDLNLRGRVLDFGAVRTNGSAFIHREGREWVLEPYPRRRPFELYLNEKAFGRPGTVASAGGSSGTVIPIRGRGEWKLPLNGARRYRWHAG